MPSLMGEHLMVAQPRIRDERAPRLSVGVLPWTARGVEEGDEVRDHLAFIVKAAFSFGAESGRATLAAAPGLNVETQAALHGALSGELSAPSDFVPRKARVDVLLTGHAYAATPAARIDSSIAIGAWKRAFSTTAGGTSAHLPLVGAYVRSTDGLGGAEPVGPTRSATRVAALEGLDEFDFRRNQSATREQQIDRFHLGMPLDLVGLSPRATSLRVRLPRVAPKLVLAEIDGTDTPVALELDTLLIDTDAELVTVTWRGSAAIESFYSVGDIERIDAWLETTTAPRSLSEVRRALQRGHFEYAAELDIEAAEVAVVPPPGEEELAAATYALWDQAPEPTIRLQNFAQISAELMEERERPRDTLARHGLDEAGWALEERAWLEALGVATGQGDASAAKRFGDLLIEAQNQLAAPHEAELTLDDYVRIRAATERGADVHDVLAHFGLTMPAWQRLDRRFTAMTDADAALSAEVERRVRSEPVDQALLTDDLDDADDTEESDEGEEDDG